MGETDTEYESDLSFFTTGKQREFENDLLFFSIISDNSHLPPHLTQPGVHAPTSAPPTTTP